MEGFRFLREAARPDSDFIGWYEPAIGEQGKEPDFILFLNRFGLLILEGKDWREGGKQDQSGSAGQGYIQNKTVR